MKSAGDAATMSEAVAVSSHNTASRTWSDVSNLIKNQIRIAKWVNTDSEEPHTTFISRHVLESIWRGNGQPEVSPFLLLRTTCDWHDIELKPFEKRTLLLLSALVYYDFNPENPLLGDQKCTLRNDGLSVPGLSAPIRDSDMPLPSEKIKAIFGNINLDFKDGQYKFCPAVLHNKEGTGFFHFPEGTRLPFEYQINEEKRHGWYGQVSKVRIKTGYFKQSSFDRRVVACKTISHSRNNFHKELKNLDLIRRNLLQHAHVVSHIAAITVLPNSFNIVFPWAWTDLADFLRNTERDFPQWLDPENVTPHWLLNELGYLAHALEFLHSGQIKTQQNQGVFLYHMDLKPDNILIFQPRTVQELEEHPVGWWKITDFGLSDTQTVRTTGDVLGLLPSREKSAGQPLVRHSGPYQAPEVEGLHQFEGHRVDHAKADVWSYGTVLVEVLAFALGGSATVGRMRDSLNRTGSEADNHDRDQHFYCVTDDYRYELLPALTSFFEAQLEFLQEPMLPWARDLWIKIREGILQIEPSRRKSAGKIQDLVAMAGAAPMTPILSDTHSSTLSITTRIRTYTCLNADSTEAISDRSRNSSLSSTVDSRQQSTETDSDVGPASSPMLLPVISTSAPRETTSLPLPLLQTQCDGQGQDSATQSLSRFYDSPQSLGSPFRYNRNASYGSSSQGRNLDSPLRLQARLEAAIDSPISSASNPPIPTLRPQITSDIVSFPKHDHKKRLSPKFVVTNAIGTEAIFSDEKRLCRVRVLPMTRPECMGFIPRDGKDKLHYDSIRISDSVMVMREASKLSIHDLVASNIVVNSERLGEIIGEGHVIRFNISRDDRLALELQHVIQIIDLRTGQLMLWHEKHGCNMADLTFDDSGNSLFAVSRDSYFVWRYQDFNHEFSMICNTQHHLVSTTQVFWPLLIPLDLPLACLMQDRNQPKDICYLGQNLQKPLKYDAGGYKVSSRLRTTSLGKTVLVFCVGHRHIKRPKDVLLVWSLSLSASGGPVMSMAHSYPLLGDLSDGTTMRTGFNVHHGRSLTGSVIGHTGHAQLFDMTAVHEAI